MNHDEPPTNSDATMPGGGQSDGLIGSTIDGKYRIESKLGEGGMGAVYCATRLLIGDLVAIKVLHTEQVANKQAIERFRREAQAAARLKHPNVVTIHDFGVINKNLAYLVMELVEGDSLRSIIKQQGPITPSATAEIASQVCAALEEAHQRHIVHRDLKPDNIIVTTSQTGLRVKVLDFGIAKLRDLPVTADSLTQTGTVIGTPRYMSPEQCMGEELDGRSDIYSLGIILYEMLSGVVPFNAPSLTALIMQQVNQAPPSLRAININITPAIEQVVMWALEKRPEARPQTAGALAQALRNTTVNGERYAETTVRQQIILTYPAPSVPTSGGAGAELAPTVPIQQHFSSPRAAMAATSKTNSRLVPLLIGGVLILLSALGVITWLLLTRDAKVINNPPGNPDIALWSEDKIVKGDVISESDLSGLSLAEIKRLRNTIFARHGRIFQTPELNNYFASRPWYKPRDNYSDGDLTPNDRANIRTITATENRLGGTDSTPKGVETSVTATASSTRDVFRGIGYEPEKALDGSMMTAWVEGVKGPGIGEWIRFDFSKEVKLRRVFIAPGYFKSPQIWQKNNRIAAAVFYFSDGNSREFRFPDRMEEQKIEMGDVRTKWVRIEIKQVYIAQSDSEDTAISQITFEWEP
ncbi:MAG TPA: protein kinase [Blastocatellia bacterium]|nr:protein kinase [Blastocatellia bacterium]